MTYQLPAYMLGLDLGKKRDYTALAVLRQHPDPGGYRYDLVHLDRWRGRGYRDVIPAINQVVHQLRQVAMEEYLHTYGYTRPGEGEPMISLVVDQTGVGEAVIEDLRAAGLGFQGIVIHGGDTVSRMDGGYRVPKRELVSIAEVLLQNHRLQIGKALPLADVLVQEMQAFKASTKLTTGHTSYAADESWRENPHDDTVLAVALAAWYGEYVDPVRRQQRFDAIVDAWSDYYA